MTARACCVGALLVVTGSLVACGSKGDRSFETATDPTTAAEAGPGSGSDAAKAEDGGVVTSNGSRPGVGYPDGGCNPFTCRTGCCTGDTCLPGTAPAQCGKGGLVCMNCAAMGYGCVSQGCNPAATCAGCDGCCKAGTCNPNGKTQDNACGHGGAVCVDCTSSSLACDGTGNCR